MNKNLKTYNMEKNEKLEAQIEIIEKITEIINDRYKNLNHTKNPKTKIETKIRKHELGYLRQILTMMKLEKCLDKIRKYDNAK